MRLEQAERFSERSEALRKEARTFRALYRGGATVLPL